ncbi:ABC transporter ATP-binding protein [Nocardia goodfellowii]|uniref:ABC transport system ATP-binding protein n=1 Tax=Nocardia goodfellowii TaxID=882446 RepID=A0ABS4QKB4_9NOCA|nr:ABC transporter ATP-binding protein [Nocardia goodfellowii]MBP2192150.1 putative ABC transport system ATP-binding protein [Nocardia goodfellowii]
MNDTQTAVRAIGLTKIYGSGQARVVALDEVDAAFGHGEFTAIMGPSGSGKSTLMHCLAGLDQPSAGRVLLGDVELTGLRDVELTELRRDRLGFVFQAFNLLPTLTALENIELPFSLAGRQPDSEAIDRVVAELGLSDRLSHRPTQLSGGQQQRVAVARALATGPEVVFADEPTGALDSAASAELLELLRTTVHSLGHTVVMVTHEPSAAAYADRVLFLADGSIVDELREPTADQVLARMYSLDGLR